MRQGLPAKRTWDVGDSKLQQVPLNPPENIGRNGGVLLTLKLSLLRVEQVNPLQARC